MARRPPSITSIKFITFITFGIALGAALGWAVWHPLERSAPDAGREIPLPEDPAALPGPVRPLVEAAARTLRDRPDDPAAVADLGRVYHGNNRFDLAGRCYALAIERGSTDPSVPYLLGLVHAGAGDAAAAEAAFRQSLAIAPDTALAWLHLGRALLDLGRLDEAIDALGRAAGADPGSPACLTSYAEALRQAGRLVEAETALSAALRAAPDDLAAHQLLGLVLRGQGRAQEARPHLARASRARGGVSEVLDDPWLAGAQQHAAVLEILLDRVEHHLDAGRPASAASQAGRAVALYPASAKARRAHARALLRAGRPQEAIDAYLTAAERDPRDALVRAGLAGILFDHGRFEDAAHEADLALQIDPECGEALAVDAALAVKRNDADAALAILRPLLERRPDIVAAHLWLGEALAMKGERRAAADAFNEAVLREPSFEYARRRLEEMRRAGD